MSNQIVQGTLTAFGHAPYKDDEKNQASFYVEIETATGKNNAAYRKWAASQGRDNEYVCLQQYLSSGSRIPK